MFLASAYSKAMLAPRFSRVFARIAVDFIKVLGLYLQIRGKSATSFLKH
jgi:hypothetical protein